MPFKSQAQWRKFGHMLGTGEITKATFDEFAHSTPGGYDNLPERKATTKKPAQPASQPARNTTARKKTGSTVTTGSTVSRVSKMKRVRKLGRGGSGTPSRGRRR